MKVPKTFMPDKDLSKKIEELSKGPKNIGVKELLKDNMQILHGDATGLFQRIKTEDDIFRGIVEDTFAGKIEWKKNPHPPEEYTANATVISYEGRKITIPILFRTDDEFYLLEYPEKRWGYLHLGNEKGPLRNTNEQHVKRLAEDYFKIRLDRPKKAYNKK